MAWNEPGGNGKDPWGGRKNDGPPDLDEVFRNFQNKLRGLFGGGSGGGRGGGSSTIGLGLILGAIFVIWGLSGIYIVDEGERGVVLQFGDYVETTQPGPHWYPRIVQTVETVNVSNVREAEGQAHVLTGDENIVQLGYSIQYNLKDPFAYLYEVTDPDLTLQQAGESAFREVVGKNTLDYVIQEGRDEVPVKVKSLLQENLDLYNTGLNVTNVNLISAQPPQEVQEAFDDAIKAREDKDRLIQQAEAYRNGIIPVARGEARSMIEQAKAYTVSVVKSAQGEADRFVKLLGEYEKAPRVTRERLYLDTLQTVLSKNGKVLVDVEGGNNMMYLPLDKILSKHKGRVSVESVSPGSGNSDSGGSNTGGSRENYRSRGRN